MAKIIEYKGMELEFQDFRRSHANGGQLPKLWVRDRLTGRIFLIKGNSLFNTEPFGEKLAYIIGRDLGIDVLEYDLIKTDEINRVFGGDLLNCKYASICEKIDRKGCSITSVAEVKRARNVISEHKVTNKEIMYELLPKYYIDTMFLTGRQNLQIKDLMLLLEIVIDIMEMCICLEILKENFQEHPYLIMVQVYYQMYHYYLLWLANIKWVRSSIILIQ